MTKDEALDRKAENARELGLDYEPDWTPEEDEAFNMVEKHSNLGKQILREMGQPYHFEKREWVGLTDEEILAVNMSTVTKLIDEPIVCDTDHNIVQLGKAIEAKLKEKNTWK